MKQILTEGAFSQYTYKVPTSDVEKIMFDFYALINVGHGVTGFPPPIPEIERRPSHYSDELNDVRDESIDTLLAFLKPHLLKSVLFALCAEFRHIFDNNKSSKLKQFAESKFGKEGLDFIGKYSKEYVIRQNPKSARFIDDETSRRFKKDDRGYQDSYNAVKSTGVSATFFAKFAEQAFLRDNLEWSSSFGGKPWSNIAKAWTKLAEAEHRADIVIYIDHIYDLQHNTDTVFNKLKLYYKEGYGWIKKALDLKAKTENFYNIINKASPDLKPFLYSFAHIAYGVTKEVFENPPKTKPISKQRRTDDEDDDFDPTKDDDEMSDEEMESHPYSKSKPKANSKKYKLLKKTAGGNYIIQAIKDFVCHGIKISAGDVGGIVSGEKSLSQFGTCWITENATVIENALVIDDALVTQNANVIEDAEISGAATISGYAIISGDAVVEGAAIVKDSAHVSGNAVVGDAAIISGDAEIFANATVLGNSKLEAGKFGAHTVTGTPYSKAALKSAIDAIKFASNDVSTEDGTMKYSTRPTVVRGKKYLRIICERDFTNPVVGQTIYLGDNGGLIDKTENLSQKGLCWVAKDSIVEDNARVSENAWIGGRSVISEDAAVIEDSRVINSKVGESAIVHGHAAVISSSHISGQAIIKDNAVVSNSAVYGTALIKGNAHIDEDNIAGGTYESGNKRASSNDEVNDKPTNKKYKLVPDQGADGMYRIIAVTTFTIRQYLVKIGDNGGLVESEKNLSQRGLCWVNKDSQVVGNANVSEGAFITGRSIISDDAQIFGNATVLNSQVYENAKVSGKAVISESHVYGNAVVNGNAQVVESNVAGNAMVGGDYIMNGAKVAGPKGTIISGHFGLDAPKLTDAVKDSNLKYKREKSYSDSYDRIVALKTFKLNFFNGLEVKEGEIGGLLGKKATLSQEGMCWIHQNATVSDDASISGNALISGSAILRNAVVVSGEAIISGDAILLDSVKVSGQAQIYDHAILQNYAVVTGNAIIKGSATISGNITIKTGTYFKGEYFKAEELKESSINKLSDLLDEGDEKIFHAPSAVSNFNFVLPDDGNIIPCASYRHEEVCERWIQTYHKDEFEAEYEQLISNDQCCADAAAYAILKRRHSIIRVSTADYNVHGSIVVSFPTNANEKQRAALISKFDKLSETFNIGKVEVGFFGSNYKEDTYGTFNSYESFRKYVDTGVMPTSARIHESSNKLSNLLESENSFTCPAFIVKDGSIFGKGYEPFDHIEALETNYPLLYKTHRKLGDDSLELIASKQLGLIKVANYFRSERLVFLWSKLIEPTFEQKQKMKDLIESFAFSQNKDFDVWFYHLEYPSPILRAHGFDRAIEAVNSL